MVGVVLLGLYCAPTWTIIYVIMTLSVSIVLFIPVKRFSTLIKSGFLEKCSFEKRGTPC